MGHTVRGHTRRTASGRTTTVHQHAKSGGGAPRVQSRPARRGASGPFAVGVGLLSRPRPTTQRKKKKSLARRGGRNLIKFWKAASRRKKLAAVGFASLATIQLTAFVGLQGVAVAGTAIGITAIVTASVARYFAAGRGR